LLFSNLIPYAIIIIVNRLLRDAEHFDSKLGKIDGAGDTGQYLMGIVKEKVVAVPTAPAPPPQPAQAPQLQLQPNQVAALAPMIDADNHPAAQTDGQNAEG
jgi:hypothetical protein